MLDEKDRQDLFIVSENLDKPDLVIKAASGDRALSATHLVVKTKENDGIHFWDIDVETQAKIEIPWK
ncbi:MAG TPA: hypothetical protein VM940_14475 [Chthoniobacterales bacterium]|nr:hypothetical protein [Chthoniobacterales bacterium]